MPRRWSRKSSNLWASRCPIFLSASAPGTIGAKGQDNGHRWRYYQWGHRLAPSAPAGGAGPGSHLYRRIRARYVRDVRAFHAVRYGKCRASGTARPQDVHADDRPDVSVLLPADDRLDGVVHRRLRAALRPEESSFASLRLGMDELRMVGLFLLFAIAGFVLMVVMSIIMTFVFGAVGFFGSMANGSQPGAGFVLMMLAIYVLPTFLIVRLAPAFALTVMRRKIVIGEAWTLTSGLFWVMFAGYLVLNLLIFIVYLVLVFAVISPLMVMMMGSDPTAAMGMMQGHVGGGIAAAMAVFGLIFAILAGVSMAFNVGGLAAATRSLTGESDTDLAETFA